MKSCRLLASLAGAVLLLHVSAGVAGVNSWTLVGPPGGQTHAVAVHPSDPNILFASMGNGLYRSTDGGATWTYRADVFGALALVFDPSNPERLYALHGAGRIMRSEDGAATFTQLVDPPNFTHVEHIAVATDGTLYVADERGDLYKSVNAGSTWITLSVPWSTGDSLGGAIAVDPANANNVLVGIRGVGTYRTVDGGANWTPLPIANSPGSHSSLERVLDFAFKPGASACAIAVGDAGVQVSNDGGASWASPVLGAGQSVAFDPARPTDVVVVGALSRIWRSTNSGATWNAGVDLKNLFSSDIAFGSDHRAIVAGSDGPLVSDDGGVTFDLRPTGILAQSVRAFTTAADGWNFASFSPGPFGVYSLEGTSWKPLGTDALLTNLPFYPNIVALAVAPNDTSRLYAVGTVDSFMTSFDRGQTWTPPVLQFKNTNINIGRIYVDPTDKKIVYVTTMADGIWRSENDGFAFVKRSTGLPTQVSSLAIDPVNPAVLYAGDAAMVSSGIWKSTDSGVSWNPLGTTTLGTSAVGEIEIDPANPQHVYASLRDGLHHSTDGGTTWTFTGPAGISANAIILDKSYPHTVIYGGISASPGFTAFARSVDDGAHWQLVPSALVHPALGGFDFVTFDRGFGMVYAGGIGTGLHQYQISNDLAVELGAVPAALPLGSTGQFQVIVRNLGPFDAAAPTLDIRVPANVTLAAPPAGCQPFQDVFRCVLPGLRNGQSQTLTVDYTAGALPSGGGLSAAIMGREYDTAGSNNQAGKDVWVRRVTDLIVTSTAPASVQTGSPITFTAKVTNGGPNDSDSTTYVLTTPGAVTVQTATSTSGTCTVGALITCEIGALANGASATVTIAATASQAATLTWASLVKGSAEDPTTANNTTSASTAATAPPPPPPPPSSGKGGGGRIDWLLLALLAVTLVAQARRGRRARS